MIKKKKILVAEEMPEFDARIENMPVESKIFVDKSLEIANFIFEIMEQKGLKQKDLATKMGKTEAEVSKLLRGMHNYTLRSIAKIEAALEVTVIYTPMSNKISFPKLSDGKNSCVVLGTEKESIKLLNGISYGGKLVRFGQSHLLKTETIAV
jgi:transcriptional regulator with XRE-family HTH domain